MDKSDVETQSCSHLHREATSAAEVWMCDAPKQLITCKLLDAFGMLIAYDTCFSMLLSEQTRARCVDCN